MILNFRTCILLFQRKKNIRLGHTRTTEISTEIEVSISREEIAQILEMAKSDTVKEANSLGMVLQNESISII